MDRSRRELPGIQLPPIHTLAPLPAPIARPAAFAVAHRTQDGHQAYDYGDLHETASGGGYSYYSSSQTPAPREMPTQAKTIVSDYDCSSRPSSATPPSSASQVCPPTSDLCRPRTPPLAPFALHPPRDKSTRTLILDHLLWMHARARFGAARGELGVGTRPHLESKDACLETLEDHGVMGLGLFEEGLDKLSYPDVKLIEPDPDVLTAMLDQTPAPDPIPSDEDDMLVDSASSTSVASSQKLPNSVRLRLALSLLVNELFSPEPEPASAPTQQAPPALLSLAQVAPPPPASLLCSPTPVTLPSFQQFTSGAPATSQSIFNSIPRGQGVEGPWTYPRTGPAPAYFRDGVLEDPYVHQTQRCVRHLSPVDRPWSSVSSRVEPAPLVQDWEEPVVPSSPCTNKHPDSKIEHEQEYEHQSTHTGSCTRISGTVPQDSRLTALISRFLRLSALVAIELGREARGEEDGFGTRTSSGSSTDGSDDESPRKRTIYVRGRPIAGSLRAGKQAKPSVHAHARPTRVWYALLCGLVTRACLEGYLMRGWKGTLGAEILFRIGAKADTTSDGTRKFSPQEERDLLQYEARERALAAMGEGEGSEEERQWEEELRSRLVEFTTVPNDIPSLSTHLESLASRYSAEPVERAALRFCESVARWRGKPELETPVSQASDRALFPLAGRQDPRSDVGRSTAIDNADELEASKAARRSRTEREESQRRGVR
ncbi:hypothetical protein RHS01_06206 [Rhizoctonia solani]|uniref:Uncharacterized protein n=1 Tax=Rhizoctonia solani TaxID=456999 RepID=A0A8H7I9A7_9AGAM|nr:hypothetical protein RHS01_06206 [Rhizoctonia solani]